jgi:AcrR family transcriptional regulator
VKKPTVAERRIEILEATCDVVIERGFAGTRISDVAKQLDVSSSLIHYHFDSKEQLLAEAFAHYARKDLAELDLEIESAPSALVQLDRAIQNYVPEGSDDVEWMLWIDGWGEALRNPMMKRISQELDEQSVSQLQRVLSHGVDTGEFVCPDPHASAIRLTALVDGLAVQFAAHEGMIDRDELIGHVRSLAAHEAGLALHAFDDVQRQITSSAAPSPATDAALRRLIALYCDGVIRNDVDTWSATWATDAVWHLADAPIVGRAAIVAAWQKAMSKFTQVVHVAPQMLFNVDDAAGVGTGRVTISERCQRANGKSFTLVGTYHDRYVRVGQTWLFAERRLEVLESA